MRRDGGTLRFKRPGVQPVTELEAEMTCDDIRRPTELKRESSQNKSKAKSAGGKEDSKVF